MKLTIDGKTIKGKEGESLLQCALRHDIAIPHLCTHSVLPAFGACRLCVVEIEGMRGYPTSCTTPAADGMVVETNTDSLQKLRRNILALMMLEHPSACLICSKRELCEQYRPSAQKAGRTTGCHTCNNKSACEVRALAEELGLTDLAIAPSYKHRPVDRSNPFIDRDPNLCILCGRCVRICKYQYGTGVIDFVDRGSETCIGTVFDRPLLDAGCRFCGSCIDVCPTGALSDRYAKWYPKSDAATESTCIFCDQACALKLDANDDKLISASALDEKTPICMLGRFAIPEFLNGTDRLAVPYVRVGTVLRETEWKDAVKISAEKLKDFTGDAFAFVCDTTSTIEERYIFKKFTEEVMKSKNYIEIEPTSDGTSLSSLPKGTKAVVLTGNFVPADQLDGLELLIVMDCYPTDVSERGDIVLPVTIFAEIDGTIADSTGQNRPLRKACQPPGQAKPQWWIISAIAGKMGAADFAYKSSSAIRKELGSSKAKLQTERDETPPAADDINLRRTYFRGHNIDEKVLALRELSIEDAPIPPKEKSKITDGFEILEKQEIAPNVHEIVIKAPEVAKKAQPGQFIILMVDQESERVPFTLCDWDGEKGTITLVVLEVGQSSRKLVLLEPGDKLAHVVGPLGIPLEIKNYGKVVLAAGCYGIGAILRIAAALKQIGNHVTVITEGRSHYKHYYKEKLTAACDEMIQTAIDGSLSVRGHAVDALGQKLKDGEKFDLVIAIGCPFMMMLTQQETKPYELKTLAALNPIMLDGTGMCGACRLTVGDETKFACVDGPFFDAHLVDWEELWDRRVAYSAEEIHLVGRTESVTHRHGEHKCNGKCSK